MPAKKNTKKTKAKKSAKTIITKTSSEPEAKTEHLKTEQPTTPPVTTVAPATTPAPTIPKTQSHTLSNLTFAVSIIFYILAVYALSQAQKNPEHYKTMFFLIMDGIIFGATAFFIRTRLEAVQHTTTAPIIPNTGA